MLIRHFVSQTLCHISLILCVCCLPEGSTKLFVIVAQNLKDCILLVLATSVVVDRVIKDGSYVVFRVVLLEEMVVLNSLGDIFRCKNGMELTVMAEHKTIFHNLVHHCYVMRL